MKVCGNCGEEISTKDGANECATCEDAPKKARQRRRASLQRRERDAALRSLGLRKVRGAMGGTYWE